MHSTTCTDTAQNTQAQKTSKAKKVSPEVQARREAVWKGEHCPRIVDSVNMSLAITQLNIGKYGNVINLCWTLFSKLTRTKKTDDLGRESVWIDLKESRFDSMDTCAENMGLTRRAMEKVFQYAKELDIIRNTGASGKRTREYAFGDAMIKALTGEPTMHRGNKKPAKRAGKETPLNGALETPLSGVLVLKDLGSHSSEEPKNKTKPLPSGGVISLTSLGEKVDVGKQNPPPLERVGSSFDSSRESALNLAPSDYVDMVSSKVKQARKKADGSIWVPRIEVANRAAKKFITDYGHEMMMLVCRTLLEKGRVSVSPEMFEEVKTYIEGAHNEF